jgi:hypothetical protein
MRRDRGRDAMNGRHPAPEPSRQPPLGEGARAPIATERRSGAEDVLLALQRTAGNAAVARLIASPFLRAISIQRDVAATHVLDKGDEADVPAVEDIAALRDEAMPLWLESKAAKVKGAEPMDPKRRARMNEIDRLLRLRGQMDIKLTLQENKQVAPAAWFKEVKDHRFLGKTVTVHKLLADRLDLATAKLKDIPDATKNAWITETSSLRPPGAGLHSFGLAIDINQSTNPYLVTPSSGSQAATDEPLATSTAIRAIIDRAVLLVHARLPKDEKFGARPEGEGAARVTASYDKLEEASKALAEYMGLDKPDQKDQLHAKVEALSGIDPDKRTEKQWRAKIAADRNALPDLAGNKSWDRPTSGFLNLERQLVSALTDADGGGLTWLGDDTIGSGRDIMHFDMRALGPIHSVYKWSQGSKNLGSG